MKDSKISSFVLYALMAITVVVCAFFYIGDTESCSTTAGTLDAPVYTSMLINWAYILIVIAAVATLGFALMTFVSKVLYDVKSVIVPVVAVGVLAIVLLSTYFGADTTQMNIIGYEGSQEPWVYRVTNMCIVSSIVLAAIATIATLFGSLAKKF